jgi:hypothetical protein
MNQEIATGTFYILAILTFTLQLLMYYRRGKFLRTSKGQREIINFKGRKIEELVTLLRIVIPVKLTSVKDGQLEQLRKSAVTASNYWIVSLLLTFVLPLILFNLTK